MESSMPRRILIIKTHAIGDLLMTTPAIRDLRQAHPTAHITLLVGSWSAPAIRKNPHIDEFIEFDDTVFLKKRWLRIAGLLWKIRRRQFDLAIIFHPLPLVHLFSLLAGIPLRYGLTFGARNLFLSAAVPEDLGATTYYPVNFQRVAALAGAHMGTPDLEVHESAGDESEATDLLLRNGIAPGDDFILVAPGGGRNTKEDVAARRWAPEKFAELMRGARRTHPHLKFVLTGGAGDARETAQIAGAVPGVVNLTAQTSLTQLYALTRRARAVVCNDSSLLHIAVACKKPAIAPFGPTGLLQRLPAWAAGYSEQSAIACSPCYIGGRFPGCEIGFQCMQEITPEKLLSRLERALEPGHSPLL